MTIATVTLGSVADLLSGFAFKADRFSTLGDLPVVRIRDVKRGFSETYYTGEFDDRYLVDDGDLLIGMDGEFNRECWAGGKALLNQRVCKIIPHERSISARYLYHFLPEALQSIEDRTPFATVKHLSSKEIQSIQIPLPQLDEQRRIATILDKADALRRKRKRALDLLDSLTQSIFLEMFGDPVSNPKKWARPQLGTMCKRLTVGIVVKPASYYVPVGVPAIRSLNIRENGFDLSDLVFVSPQNNVGALAKSRIFQNDVVIVRTGQPGKAAVVTADLDNTNAIDILGRELNKSIDLIMSC